MTTNLLAIPLVTVTVVTGTNEDWIDSIKFVVDDESGLVDDMPQLDLGGIQFDMEVRRQVPNNEVVLRASTTDGRLKIGEAPNFGFLLITIDHEDMMRFAPGDYSADIVGSDGQAVRRCVIIALQVDFGVTRP